MLQTLGFFAKKDNKNWQVCDSMAHAYVCVYMYLSPLIQEDVILSILIY